MQHRQRNALIHVVVKLPANCGPFLLLRLNQPLAEIRNDRFSFFAFGNIGHDGHPSVYVSRRIERRSISARDPSRADAFKTHFRFVARFLASESALEIRQQSFKYILSQHILDRAPYDFVQWTPEESRITPTDPQVPEITTAACHPYHFFGRDF